MKTRILFGLLLLAGAVLSLSLVHAAEPAPVPVVTQAEYGQAVGAVVRAFGRKPAAALEAYLKLFDELPGLAPHMRLDLFRRMLVQAFAADDEAYATQLARFAAEPDSTQKGETWRALMRDFAKAGDAQLLEAQRLYGEHAQTLTPRQRIASLADLSVGGLQQDGDVERFRAGFEAIREMADPSVADERARASFDQYQTDTLVAMISSLMPFDGEAATAFTAAVAARLDAPRLLALDHGRILAAIQNADRSAFDAALAVFEKNPDQVAKLRYYGPITDGLSKSDLEAAAKILRDALARPAYDAAQRQGLIAQLCRLHRPSAFKYGGFYTSGDYESYRALADENVGAIERALAEGSLKHSRNLAGQFHDMALTAADFGDYAFADAMLAKARANHATDFAFVPLALRLALRSNTLEAVRAVIDPVLADEKQSVDNQNVLAAVLFIYQQKEFKQFDAAVYGDHSFTAADRMVLIRRASELLFRGERYDLCRRAHAEVFDKMFTPVLYKTYAVQYIPNLPRTADAWARSPHYARWEAMETRFVPYGEGYDMGNRTDSERHLKGVEIPDIPDAYRTGVHIACDDTGLHIYIRCDNPNVDEIVAGQRKGESLELLMRPSEDAAYHSWYFNAAPVDNDEPHLVNWASPSPRYRQTYDFFQKDAATTPEAVVAHTVIPWLAFHDTLPFDGKTWKFGMQRWGPHPVTLSGSVHELARALKLTFALTPAQETSIKRHTAVLAFNRYNTIRQDKGGFIQTWNDKLLGDPDFYKTELEERIASLDAAGKRLLAPAPDAEIAAIFEQFVPLWFEINHVVAERRNVYLKQQLLKDEGGILDGTVPPHLRGGSD